MFPHYMVTVKLIHLVQTATGRTL